MTKHIILVQLISEQTMPNLLALLRLQPQKVIHLFTPRTESQSLHLKNAAHLLYPHIKWEFLCMSAMPSMLETHHAITHIYEAEKASNPPSTIFINFTGGTKLMSIGAYAAALQHKLPSLYVDTLSRKFIDGQTSVHLKHHLHGDASFVDLLDSLSVQLIGSANGICHIDAGKPWQNILPLAQHLFRSKSDEKQTHEAMHGSNGICPDAREPTNPSDWLHLLDQPILLPPHVAKLAIECGIARAGSTASTILLPDCTRQNLDFLINHRVQDYHKQYFEAIAPLQHTIALLSGAWWEVHVCHAAYESGHVSDIRWSCNVNDGNGLYTETDILGLSGVELIYISCKRSGQKKRLLPLLEETKARAATIGGTFNRRFLAILDLPNGKGYTELVHRAKVHGISIITRNNVSDPNVFAK